MPKMLMFIVFQNLRSHRLKNGPRGLGSIGVKRALLHDHLMSVRILSPVGLSACDAAKSYLRKQLGHSGQH